MSETYTITNTGTAALTLGTVSISGTNAGDFMVTAQPSTLGGGRLQHDLYRPVLADGRRHPHGDAQLHRERCPTASPFTFAVSGVATPIEVTGGSPAEAISDGSTTDRHGQRHGAGSRLSAAPRSARPTRLPTAAPLP